MPESLATSPNSLIRRKAELVGSSDYDLDKAAIEASGGYWEYDCGLSVVHFGWRQSMGVGHWRPSADLNQASELLEQAVKSHPRWYVTALQTDKHFHAKATRDSNTGPNGLIQADLKVPNGNAIGKARILTILAILILTDK